MQFIPFCLFTIICGYSLVISAPVNQKAPDSQETKQQKATAIASRLLKELAGEQLASHHKVPVSNNNENKDNIISVNRPETQQVELDIEKQNNNDDDVDSGEDYEFMPTIDDLYQIYNDKYEQLADDEVSSETNDDYILPIRKQNLMRYLAEQTENDEQLTPVIHTPVMDDSVMKAENH